MAKNENNVQTLSTQRKQRTDAQYSIKTKD